MRSLISTAILLLGLAVIVNAKPHHGPEAKEAWNACLAELNTTAEVHHGQKKNGEFKNEDCLLACLNKRSGLINKDGKIDKETAISSFPPHVPKENATSIVEACFELKGKNDCETAVLYKNCIKKSIPHSPKHQEMAKRYDECKKKLNLTDEDLEKLRNSRNDAKEDCFLHCLASKFGFLNEDGTVNKEVVVKKSPPHKKEKAEAISNECAKEVGENECETALRVYKCFEKNDFKVGHHFGAGPPRPEDE